MSFSYIGYSQDLSHPADRRRFASYLKVKGIKLESKYEESLNLVLTNNSNFSKYFRNDSNQNIILDLVDAYLGENPTFFKNFARNLIRTYTHKSSLRWLKYTDHLKFAVTNASVVVVPSVEQATLVHQYNPNVKVIPDNLIEIDNLKYVHEKNNEDSIRNGVIWEGQSNNLKHLFSISKQIEDFLEQENYNLYIITGEKLYKYADQFFEQNLYKKIKINFPRSYKRIRIIPWSLPNLLDYSKKSRFAIIPICENDSFGRLKSENKLISFWKLHLPVIASAIPSYLRVCTSSKSEVSICFDNWTDKMINFSKISMQSYFDESNIVSTLKESYSSNAIIELWDHCVLR